MQVKFDYFNMPEDPQLFVCNANNHRLASIARYSDSNGTNTLNITMNYNRTSELSIQIYKFIEDTFHREAINSSGIAECYQYIKNFRQIHVEGLGYFVITEATEVNDGFDPYWKVTATSCEREINDKGIVLPKGTYQFWDANNPSNTILGKILNLCPKWSVGTVSPTVAAIYRTFDDLSQTVYNFMMNDMANAYSCICDFDIENRKINIIDMSSEIPSTDILLTYDNVLNNINVDQNSENILTALNVSGGSDSVDGSFDITSVNPIGGNVIYRFDPFMNLTDMNQDLIDAINAWQTKVNNNQTVFSNLVLQIQNAQSTLETLQGNLADLNTDLKALNQQLSVAMVANDGTYSGIKAQIDAKQAAINSKQTDINNQNSQITTLENQLSTLQSSLAMQNNFTADQFKQLSSFIHQSDFKDENIIVTNSMTYVTKQAQAQALYDKAELLLSQRCQPTSTVEIDCINFILMPEFDRFRDQIELGKMIHVEMSRDNILDMMLLQYQINYDTKELKISVSNRLKLHDSIKDVQDWQTQLQASANTLSLNGLKWSYPNGVITNIENFVASPIDMTKNGIIAAQDQKMLIDSTGYHGFQYTNGSYDPNQCWMTNQGLYFTTDAWDTVKCGFGKVKNKNGTLVYGLNADAIMAGAIDANTIDVKNLNADNIVAGKLQSKNGKVYFDLDNNAAAVSKIISATDNYNDVNATIGEVDWAEGTASKGMILNSSDGNFAIFDQAEANSEGNVGLEITSHGKIRLRSNAAVGSANNCHIELGGDYVSLYTTFGGLVEEYISSQGFYFNASGNNIGYIDTSNGWRGKLNGTWGTTGDVTLEDGVTVNGTTLHFEGGLYVGRST